MLQDELEAHARVRVHGGENTSTSCMRRLEADRSLVSKLATAQQEIEVLGTQLGHLQKNFWRVLPPDLSLRFAEADCGVVCAICWASHLSRTRARGSQQQSPWSLEAWGSCCGFQLDCHLDEPGSLSPHDPRHPMLPSCDQEFGGGLRHTVPESCSCCGQVSHWCSKDRAALVDCAGTWNSSTTTGARRL